MKIEIKNRWTNAVIHSGEYESIHHAMADALKLKINLCGANLRGANLRGADLCGANLCDANLCGANLRDADLRGANLRGADLCGANLCDANLCGANLCDADLSSVRADFLAEVLKLPNELEFLKDAIAAGRINGSTYSGDCACLAGTLAKARGIEDYEGTPIKNGCTFQAASSSPRERFFLAIKPGNTPENNGAAKIAFDWTNEAIAIRDNIRTPHSAVQPESKS